MKKLFSRYKFIINGLTIVTYSLNYNYNGKKRAQETIARKKETIARDIVTIA